MRIKPIAAMRVYPTPTTTLYARVLVFDTQRAMHKYALRTGHSPGRYQAVSQAIITQIRRKRRGVVRVLRTRPVFAELLFYERGISLGTVAHECFHVALMYGRRMRLDLNDLAIQDEFAARKPGVWTKARSYDVEERLAEVQDTLTHELVVALRKRGWVL